MADLQGRVAVVTGGGTGIGAGIVRRAGGRGLPPDGVGLQ